MKLNVKRWGSLALSLLMATQTVGIASAFAAETDQSQQLTMLEKVDGSQYTDTGKLVYEATGEENGSASLDLTKVAGYEAGEFNVDGGVMEIVSYNTVTGWAYAVNGQSGLLTAISLKTLEEKDTVDLLPSPPTAKCWPLRSRLRVMPTTAG